MAKAERRINHDTAAYWDGCRAKRLVIARCENCARWIHPPAAICPGCWSDSIGHHAVSGEARVYSFTVTPRSTGQEPAVTVWAELVEQSRLIVIGELDGGGAARIAIGDPLAVAWTEEPDGPVPAFRLKSPA